MIGCNPLYFINLVLSVCFIEQALMCAYDAVNALGFCCIIVV